jgi:hypothetical protein
MPARLGATVIRTKRDFVGWLDHNCPHFKLVQELANGSKHCLPTHPTDKIEGYGQGPFGIGPAGHPYLLIDLGEGKPLSERWAVAHTVLADVIAFWRAFCDGQGVT